MRITDGKGVSVEISFHELSKELQTKVYRSNREKMAKIASESHYYEVRMEVAKHATSKELLRKMLLYELHTDDISNVIFSILENENFEMDDAIREELMYSNCYDVREIVAKDNQTSKDMLYQMLYSEMRSHEDVAVIKAIVNNNNFEMDNDCRVMLAASNSWEVRLIVAKDNETPKSWLNEMLINEIKSNFECRDVTEAIIDNRNFLINKKDIDIYAKSENPNIRIFAAEDEDTTAKFLNRMLYDELEGQEDSKVIEAILYNKIFKKALIE